MNQDDLIPDKARIRIMQIIAGAMMAGILVYGVFVITTTMDQKPDEDTTMLMIGIVLAGGCMVGSIVAPLIVANTQLQQIRKPGENSQLSLKLCEIYQMKMIVGLALLEGAGFFNVFAYSQTKQILMLAIVAALLFGMLLKFPTSNKVRNWIDHHKQILELEQ